MIALQNPPEFADGGYWYVVPVSSDESVFASNGFCAWRTGNDLVVRTTSPENAPGQSNQSHSGSIQRSYDDGHIPLPVRPFGRIKGR